MKIEHLLYVFIAFYAVYLVVSADFNYLDSDEASHAMTSVFFNRLITDLSSNPSVNVYDYALAYYVRYPKFVFQYGPVYDVILAFLNPYSIFFMKLLTIFFSLGTLIVIFYLLKRFFSGEVAIMAVLLIATSSVFVNFSNRFMLDVPSVFFFSIGLFFYFDRDKSLINSLLAGLLLGVSVLTKEIALVFTGFIVLLTLKDFRKANKMNFYFLLSLFLVVLPYVLFLIFSGGIEVLLLYPEKQAWYGARGGAPQFNSLDGWLYFFKVLVDNFSFLSIPLLLLGVYYAYKAGYKNVVYFVLLTYFFVVFLGDKAPQRILHASFFICGLMAYAFSVIYVKLRVHYKLLALFLLTFVLVINLPLSFSDYEVPMSDVAVDLVNSCPNCTVLIASEFGSVYSSYLMYESLILDVNASMRFIRPTAFASISAVDLINSEQVNRVVVIGELDLIKANPETISYPSVEFIVNKYDLVGVYESDLVGRIFVYDTGINITKDAPYCATSISMGSTFCSGYLSPIDALRA